MHLIELFELIENGENGLLEFKRKFSTSEKIAKEMIAFANTRGGKIIFGVDDNRRIVGVESEKGEIELIDMAAKFYCRPEIEYDSDIVNIHKKDVIVVDIKESFNKPHKLVGQNGSPERVYIRIKDKSVLASKETVKVLQKSNPGSSPLFFSLGEHEKFLLDYLSLHDKVTVSSFRKMLNLSGRRASRILINLVRAELIRLHSMEKEDFYTLS
jgi:predicted HTH transcriptional regulator